MTIEEIGGEIQLKIQQEIDERKKKIALEKGYKILYISYKQLSEIDNILVQQLSSTEEQE